MQRKTLFFFCSLADSVTVTNPFLAWGRYRKGWLTTTLPISFQFHHAQMDGGHAVHFLEELQKTISQV